MPLATPTRRTTVLRVLDHLFACRQLDVGFLPVAPVTFGAARGGETFRENSPCARPTFTLKICCTASLICVLVASRRHFKHHRVLRLLHAQTLFGDDRPANHLIERSSPSLIPFSLWAWTSALSFLAAAAFSPLSARSFRLGFGSLSPGPPLLGRVGAGSTAPALRASRPKARGSSLHGRVLRQHQPVVPQQIVGLQRLSA